MPKIITHADIIERLSKLNPNIEIAEQYHGMLSKTKFHCLIHDYDWESQVNHVLEGHGCPKCAGYKMRTNDEFKKEVYAMNSNIEIIDEYTLFETQIKCRCLICNNVWFPYPAVLLRGGGCPKCARKNNGLKQRNTHEIFMLKMQKNNPDVEVLERYVHGKSKIKVRCKKCSFEWSAIPNNISNENHTGCPRCNSSHGEKEVEKYLQSNNLCYQPQYSFVSLGRKKFDFAVFNNSNELLCLIEYDGEQHYKPVDFGGKGEEWALHHFQDTQKRDREKDDYCLKNDIVLIRIPYFVNVSDELNKRLKEVLMRG